MEAEINEFIGVFDNTVPNEYCDSLIDFFDRMQNIGKAVSRAKYTGASPVKQDNSLYYFINETDPLILDTNLHIMAPFADVIEKCYHLYVEEYGTIENLGKHGLNPDIKLQKTIPGEGYHVWHCEQGNIPSSRRLLLCMLYLNDVDEGGETEFLYQSKRIKPVKGRVVICPTAFTHTHRGNPPLNTAKYMINGWLEFISF